MTASALAAGVPAGIRAQEAMRSFDIPPQRLGTAIERFIEQAHIDLLYDSALIADMITPGVSGHMTVGEAIIMLLRGSGLRHIFISPDAVAIQQDGADIGSSASVPGAPAADPLRMPPMVVTATRGTIDVREAPAAVTVLAAEDLERRHVLTLDQALQTTPGAFARRSRGLMDTGAVISFRGFPGQRRTMVMVDGLALNDIYSSEVNFPSIDLDTVERIEVVRGPFSSLYGGNAMSGVVNVITAPVESSGAALSLGYGDAWSGGEAPEKLFDTSFSASLKASASFGLATSYRHRGTDGYPSWYITRPWRSEAGAPIEPDLPAHIGGAVSTTNNSGAPVSTIGDAGYNGYRDDTLSLKAHWRPARRGALMLRFTRSESRYDYGERRTLLRDENGQPVFSFTPAPTASGAVSGTLEEAAFLSGGPGGQRQGTWNVNWLHGAEAFSAKLSLGFVDVGRNWFVTPSLRPRPGTEADYPPSTRVGGRGLLSQSDARHALVDYQIEIPAGRSHRLTIGASHLRGDARNEEIALRNWRDESSHGELRSQAEGRILTSALFVQDHWELGPRLAAWFGLRHDWWQTRDGHAYSFATVPDGAGSYNDIELSFPHRSVSRLSPKAALIYRYSAETSYRVSAGSAFRGPSVFELYRTWFSSTTGTEFRSNPALAPETSRSWEVGVDHTFANGVNLAATWFDTAMRDFIYRLTVVDLSPVSTFHNAARASSRGIEIGLTGNFGDFDWQANYAYTDAVIDEFPLATDPSLIEGKQIVQFPKRLANLGASWQRGRLTLGGFIHYSAQRYNTDANTDVVHGVFGSYDSPTLVDANLGWQATEHVRLSLAIDNLFDREWYDFYRAPGRSWFARVAVKM